MTYATQKTRGKVNRKCLPQPTPYFASQGINLNGDDTWQDAPCPFHPDTKSSLHINVDRGSYRCMVCGARGGDVLAFHQHKHNLNFIEACKQLGAWVEVSK